MKNIAILLLFCVMSVAASAQKIEYGIKTDAGFANQYDTNGDIISTNNHRTFNVSAVAELPVKYNFWLQTGMGLNNKGSIIVEDALTTTTRITYLTVPFNAIYKFNFPGLGKVYAGAGWYISGGINGDFFYQTPNSESNDKVAFGNNNDFRRFDTGPNFLAGIELQNRLTFNLGYALGINNIASQTQMDTGTSSIKNRLFTVGLGYLFNL